jgi:hypothetical protein
MSQDDGSKKDSSQIAQEEAKSWMKDRMENDSKGSEDNPPQSDNKSAEDNPPPQSDYQYIPPHRGFNWSGCFITAAIIIVVILVILGITCFAFSYSSN